MQFMILTLGFMLFTLARANYQMNKTGSKSIAEAFKKINESDAMQNHSKIMWVMFTILCIGSAIWDTFVVIAISFFILGVSSIMTGATGGAGILALSILIGVGLFSFLLYMSFIRGEVKDQKKAAVTVKN